MARAPAVKKIFINGVHPAKLNGSVNSNEDHKQKKDNISLVSVSTFESNTKETKIENISNIKTTLPLPTTFSQAQAVRITEISGDESDFSELQSRRGSTTETNVEPGESRKPNNTAALKWIEAGKKIRRAVAVTHALQAPESKQEKIRKQIYGSRAALPVLPVSVAILLLICNIILPGLGTVIAGFTFCCCATTYDKPDRKEIWDKVPQLIYKNIMVGVAQLFTVSFLLIGWFWSITWGVTMVRMAVERQREKKEGSDWFPDAID